MSTAPPSRSAVIPCMAFRDAPAAIEWLCRVFGFEKHAVYPAADGSIAHAELRLGGGMLMCGSINDGPFGRHIRQPDQVGGFETQAPYLLVEDADVVHARAVAAGAEIVIPLKTEDYGGRGFTCRDPEGRLWSVGTYDPWKVAS